MFLAVMNYSYGNESVISPQKEKAIRLLLYDEQTVSALKTFTQEITKSGQHKNTTETADNIYWISECLFRLKNLTFLDTLLQTGILFTQKNNADAFSKLKIIEGKSLIEKGKYKEWYGCWRNYPRKLKTLHFYAKYDWRWQTPISGCNCWIKATPLWLCAKTATMLYRRPSKQRIGQLLHIVGFDSRHSLHNIAFKQFQQELGEQHSESGKCITTWDWLQTEVWFIWSGTAFHQSLQLYKSGQDLHPRTAETYGSLAVCFSWKTIRARRCIIPWRNQIFYCNYTEKTIRIWLIPTSLWQNILFAGDKIQSEQQLLLAIDLQKYFGVNHNLYPQCIDELSKYIPTETV